MNETDIRLISAALVARARGDGWASMDGAKFLKPEHHVLISAIDELVYNAVMKLEARMTEKYGG